MTPVSCQAGSPNATVPFRRHSYVSPVAMAVIAGLGVEGYAAALRFLATNT